MVCRGPRRRGQGPNRPTRLCPKCLHAEGHIWSHGSERVSGSRLDTGRRPLQGSLVSEDLSRVRLRPVSVPFGNRYIGREERRGQSLMTIPQSDHNTAPSPDRAETDPIASSKDPVRSCQSSFAGVHSSQHLMWFTASCFVRHFGLKCKTSKLAALFQNESLCVFNNCISLVRFTLLEDHPIP